MKSYDYIPSGVCSKKISFCLQDGKLYNVQFVGGCNGNLKAIAKLLEGMDASEAVRLLKGNECGSKGTSCADQLVCAIESVVGEQEIED